MSAKNLPHLSEKQIRQMSTSQSFSRGEAYYHEHLIKNPTHQGLQLWADCYGSQLYRVSITLDQDGVESEKCTCPYDWGGICKHQVALLLTYIRQPESFYVIPSLPEMLANRSQEDLIDLIGRMTKRYPDLLSLVELSAQGTSDGTSPQPIDLNVYRRQVQRALQREECEDIVEDLQILQDMASDLFVSGDYLNSGRLYQLLLEEMNNNYDDILQQIDYDGDVCCFSQYFAEGLGECLLLGGEKLEDNYRESWLLTLLESYFKELGLGGIDYAADACDYLLKCPNDEEWSQIEERIQVEIKGASSTWSGDWKQEIMINFLALRREQQGDTKGIKDLIHELGTPKQKAFLLLEEQKIEEAITIARQHFFNSPGTMLEFANRMLKLNAGEAALKLILEVNQKQKHWGYREWLTKYYQQHGDKDIALEWQETLFMDSPSLKNYRMLQNIGQEVSKWTEVRRKVIKVLKQKKQWGILIEIALSEQEIDEALALLSKLDRWMKSSYILQVAEAAAQTRPKSAIALYQEIVEQAIEERNRKSYRIAASYLQKVKGLYESLNQKSNWKKYFEELRSSYVKLRALQDEMKKASL